MSDQIVGRVEISPEPWRIEQTRTNNWIGPGRPDGKVERVVCSTDRNGLTPEALARNDADARLIAAAPELLAACKAVLAQFEAGALQRNIDRDGDEDWAIKAIEPLNALSLMAGAIAKAEGRS